MFFSLQKFSIPGMKTNPKHTLSRKAMIIGNASFIIIVVSLLYSNKLCLCDYIACESKFKALILYYFTGLGLDLCGGAEPTMMEEACWEGGLIMPFWLICNTKNISIYAVGKPYEDMLGSLYIKWLRQSLCGEDKKNVDLKRKKQRNILTLHGWGMLSASCV
jgi:hypothetical protein